MTLASVDLPAPEHPMTRIRRAIYLSPFPLRRVFRAPPASNATQSHEMIPEPQLRCFGKRQNRGVTMIAVLRRASAMLLLGLIGCAALDAAADSTASMYPGWK